VVIPQGGGRTFSLDFLRSALPQVEEAARPQVNGADADADAILNPIGALIQQIRTAKSGWHNLIVSLTAKLVGRGVPRDAILAMAAELTWPGYTVDQTKAEIRKMVDGACRRGFAPEVDEASAIDIDDVMNVPPRPEPEPTPDRIDGNWWLTRPITRPVPVLGEVICASTRALIGGPTGAGKTHLAMAMAGAISTKRGFLHWRGPGEALPVLYLDGEMARDLIQDRMRDLHRRMGQPDIGSLHMLCREDFPAMQGLNTPIGQTFVLEWVDRLKPAIVFLDSRMSLLVGDMKDEVVWTATMPLVLALTRRRVAQVWLDHTGHDASHIYGSKTKEWQMDVVAMVEEVIGTGDGININLRFTKARRRRPETRDDFAAGTITLNQDEWRWASDDKDAPASRGKAGRPISDETELLRRTIAHLASAPDAPSIFPGPGMKPTRGNSLVVLKTELITNGWLTETYDYHEEIGGRITSLTQRGHDRLRNALNTLKRRGLCGFNRSHVWLI
jgi:energy-coupling factor transporter ATP-binding protein EcfA2